MSKLLKEPQKDLHDLKSKIENALTELDARILVVIDDVDRLTVDEMHQLFRVIKAVANFPNVIYLVAFDKEIVAKALTTPAINGTAYLEKIVQSPFDVPLPGRVRLGQLFVKQMNAVIGDIPDEIFDQEHWAGLFVEGIQHFLTTPRHIVRLINSLVVTYSMISDEVNPVDFVALETLRLFCPSVYETIRSNKEEFTGYVRMGYGRDYDAERKKAFHNNWIGTVPEEDREAVTHMVKRLFPKLNSILGNTYYGDESYGRWRSQFRVCADDRFDVYFGYMLPSGMLSSTEVREFVAKTGNVNTLLGVFTGLLEDEGPDRANRLRIYLGELGEYASDKIPVENIARVLEALFIIGDSLLDADQKQGMLDYDNGTRIKRIVWQSLKRLPKPQRFEALKMAIERGNAISTIVSEVTSANRGHARHPYGEEEHEAKQNLTSEHVEALEKLAVQKIDQDARNNSLLSRSALLSILYRWRDWAGEDAPRQWLAGIIDDDKGLLTFLEKIVSKSHSQTLGAYTKNTHYRIDPKHLEPFLDTTQLAERLGRLRQEPQAQQWSDLQRIAVDRYLIEFAARQQGKDPTFVTGIANDDE